MSADAPAVAPMTDTDLTALVAAARKRQRSTSGYSVVQRMLADPAAVLALAARCEAAEARAERLAAALADIAGMKAVTPTGDVAWMRGRARAALAALPAVAP